MGGQRGADPGVGAAVADVVGGPAFDIAGTTSASGRFSASQRRTCAAATGNAATVRTSAAATPGRMTMLNATSSVSSANTCSGVPAARLSSVGITEPSMEFSMGTQA